MIIKKYLKHLLIVFAVSCFICALFFSFNNKSSKYRIKSSLDKLDKISSLEQCSTKPNENKIENPFDDWANFITQNQKNISKKENNLEVRNSCELRQKNEPQLDYKLRKLKNKISQLFNFSTFSSVSFKDYLDKIKSNFYKITDINYLIVLLSPDLKVKNFIFKSNLSSHKTYNKTLFEQINYLKTNEKIPVSNNLIKTFIFSAFNEPIDDSIVAPFSLNYLNDKLVDNCSSKDIQAIKDDITPIIKKQLYFCKKQGGNSNCASELVNFLTVSCITKSKTLAKKAIIEKTPIKLIIDDTVLELYVKLLVINDDYIDTIPNLLRSFYMFLKIFNEKFAFSPNNNDIIANEIDEFSSSFILQKENQFKFTSLNLLNYISPYTDYELNGELNETFKFSSSIDVDTKELIRQFRNSFIFKNKSNAINTISVDGGAK